MADYSMVNYFLAVLLHCCDNRRINQWFLLYASRFFVYMPGAITQMDYHLDMTDAIFLPLTRAWGVEGYD